MFPRTHFNQIACELRGEPAGILALTAESQQVPSRARIEMDLVEVDSGRQIVSETLDGETSGALLKAKSPDALAINLIRDFVRRLYDRGR